MPALRLVGVSRTYPSAVPVHALKDVSLRVEQGEYVAIEGPSGSGKSTLLNQIALLDKPTSGQYFIDDREVGELSDVKRARLRSDNFSFVFQAFHLLDSRTVLDNVAMGTLYRGLTGERRGELAAEALEIVGLSHKAQELAANLSGGEKQRVAIARAISAGTPVVVADEPTGNLDTKNSGLVMDTLDELAARGTTVLVVTHDPKVAERADRRVRVTDGVLTENGSPPGPALDRVGRSWSSKVAPGRASLVRFRDGVADAWRGLWAKPRRTVGLIASVTVAVALALTTIGLGQTAQSQVSDIFDARRNQRVSMVSTSFGEAGPASGEQILQDQALSVDALDRLEDLSGVEAASLLVTYPDVYVSSSPQLLAGESQISAQLIGAVEGSLPTQIFEVDTGGGPPRDELSAGEVMVGSALAAQLELGPLAASPSLWLDGAPYSVAGVLTDAGLNPALLNAVVTNNDDGAEILHGPAQYANVEIWVTPGAAQQVALQAPIAWIPADPESVTVEAPPDPANFREEIEASVTNVLIALAAVALLAATLSLASAMSAAVQERTGEFGLRRAIGARRKHVAFLVFGESFIVGLIGGVMGAYASLMTVLLITLARHWQPVFDPRLLVLGVLGGILVGLIGGGVATRRASRIQPSAALRA
ncbi:ABC transporter ATP-binding protein/permease [Actinomyces minihominis]|uniref:ABC transporter ATP-binding protein/permease n=1 Tax=Actinomyces minihominis TaxID=2002838 RepID=UPI000C0717D4|nr:ABC transporter ATP-binding protein/permease [Actinomyces minihominis]